MPSEKLLTIGNLSYALVSSFHQENHGRFIGILTAREHQHKNQMDRRIGISGEVFISHFYKAIDPMNNMKFKHFLICNGEELNSEYPASYKFMCKKLVFHFHYEKQDLALKDFLGQPFPFPSEAIVDGFLGYILVIQTFNDSSMLPQGKRLKKCVVGSDENIRSGLWKNIVKRFPALTLPSLPHLKHSRMH